MDLMILDTSLEPYAMLDTYNSFIWTDRYNECGDFEIYTKMSADILDVIKQDYYLTQPNSDRVMIIEKLLISTDLEEGDNLTVTGRSLESILDRRIIWGQKTLSGNFQEGVKTLLNECIISPSNANRKIPNFIFEASTDPTITAMTIDAQYTGDNLYEVITSLCAERDIGFQITLNENKQFVFKLYTGANRSYDQSTLPYVIFSPRFDNLISSNYIESKSSLKNVTLIGGEEREDKARVWEAVGNTAGLNRREVFTNASDISSEQDDVTISAADYKLLLRQRGKEALAEPDNRAALSFEGEAETSGMFVYGVDFFQGDIVQVEDAYGHDSKARITEIVTSDDTGGFSVYPTFTIIEPDALPYGYLRLDWIQSSGTQYFDLGFSPNSTTRVVLDIDILAATTAPIFGARTAEGQGAFIAWVLSDTAFRSDYGSGNIQATVSSVLGRITIDKNGSTCSFGDSPVTNTAETFETMSNMYLLCQNTGGTADTRKLSAKLYSCKVYDHGDLIRNLVPVKNEKDTVGLYDFVEEKFYANAGTGSFVVET